MSAWKWLTCAEQLALKTAPNRILLYEKKENPLYSKTEEENWIGHILNRNCLQWQVIEGTVEATGRRGRWRKQLLNDYGEFVLDEAMDRSEDRLRDKDDVSNDGDYDMRLSAFIIEYAMDLMLFISVH